VAGEQKMELTTENAENFIEDKWLFVFFSKGDQLHLLKNGTNNVFQKMVQSYRVFIHGWIFYTEKWYLKKSITRRRRVFYKILNKCQKIVKLGCKLVEKTEKFKFFHLFLHVSHVLLILSGPFVIFLKT
jgi:hypothetical protein